jgi:protein tyrosine phosphatase
VVTLVGFANRWFQDIEREEAERAKTNADEYKESVKHHNKAKNRYQNILPCKLVRFAY